MGKGGSEGDVNVGTWRRVANKVPDFARPTMRNIWSSFNRLKLLLRRMQPEGRKHGLPGELIVSLTSHPPRFATLHLSLCCLLKQNLKADRVILWIAHQDVSLLPPKVVRLQPQGLEIRLCDDLRSYKKLVPALIEFPHAFIVTADDDLYYERSWLKSLVDGYSAEHPTIVARRVARLKRDRGGQLMRFSDWQSDAHDCAARSPSKDIMCETGAGALFPPGCLWSGATDKSLFQRLAPDGDDLWFFWCARMNGTLTTKVGGSLILVPWPDTEASSLWLSNENGGNDAMIRALTNEFGDVDLDPRDRDVT